MFVHTIRAAVWKKWLHALVLLSAAVLLLIYPQAMATGISRGLSVCSSVIIPTLYPFMLLAGWLTDSPLCRQPGRLTCAATRWLFGLPGCCGPAIFVSLVGGYPAGALTIARLLEQGRIDRDEARRMTVFCVNAGPGFIISTVGAGLLGSIKAGVLLFLSHITVSLLLGVLLGRGHHPSCKTEQLDMNSRRSVSALVTDTGKALLTMCGFILLSAAFLSLCEAAGIPSGVQQVLRLPARQVSAALAAITEVSCGCIALAENQPLAPLWLSLCLSWGGLSVHGQLTAILPSGTIDYPQFACWRILHGLLSGLTSLALFHYIPVDLATDAGGNPLLLPYGVSAGASLMLLCMSFLAMLCFSEKSTGKST